MTFTKELPLFRSLYASLDAHTSESERQRTAIKLAAFLRGAMPDRSAFEAFLACSTDDAHRAAVLDRLSKARSSARIMLGWAHAGGPDKVGSGWEGSIESDAPPAVEAPSAPAFASCGENASLPPLRRQQAHELGQLLLEDARQVIAALADLTARHGWAPSRSPRETVDESPSGGF
jgi:hypothetical protein